MRGQFFILGAILICSLLFIGLPPSQPFIAEPSQDLEYVLQNLENEFPHSLNLGLDYGNPGQTMENFTSWVRIVTRNFLINSSYFWLFAEGDPSTGNVTVSVGNYMGTGINVDVDLDGDQRNVFVQDGASDSIVFPSVSQTYSLSVSFGGESRSFGWRRDKANLFVFMELERGDSVARSEIVA